HRVLVARESLAHPCPRPPHPHRRPPAPPLRPYTTLFRSRLNFSSSVTYRRSLHKASNKQHTMQITTKTATALTACKAVPFSLLRSEEHTSELQSRFDLVCRLLLVKIEVRALHHVLSCGIG